MSGESGDNYHGCEFGSNSSFNGGESGDRTAAAKRPATVIGVNQAAQAAPIPVITAVTVNPAATAASPAVDGKVRRVGVGATATA